MTSKPPPVPPENQSHKGTGDAKAPETGSSQHGQDRSKNLAEQGQQANTKQNTTNQGYQQDR